MLTSAIAISALPACDAAEAAQFTLASGGQLGVTQGFVLGAPQVTRSVDPGQRAWVTLEVVPRPSLAEGP